MKNTFYLIFLFIATAAMLAGCEEVDGTLGHSTLTTGGKTHKISYAAQMFEYDDGYASSIQLSLVGDDLMLHLTVNAPTGNKSIPAGSYEFGGSSQYYFTGIFGVDSTKKITSGTMLVSLSGEEYTIEMNVISESGQTLTGAYTGPITWKDWSGE